MLGQILRHFPVGVYGLALVSDPDNVLGEETVQSQLVERGFSVLAEADPVRLRDELGCFGTWSAGRPLIIITAGRLKDLPYDLWQQGKRLELALHTFFPNLSYPVVKALTPNQRWQLSQIRPPDRTLGRQGSIEYVLTQLYKVSWESLAKQAGLISWLNGYLEGEGMPELLAAYWLEKVQRLNPVHRQWPLAEWLASRAAFQSFLTAEWRQFVAEKTGQFGETKPAYTLPFDKDEQLQDVLPQLVRSGMIEPVMLAEGDALPLWAQPGLRASTADFARQRVDTLLGVLDEQTANLAEARWEQWQEVAASWAELTHWRYHPKRHDTEAQRAAYAERQATLDDFLARWLQEMYAPLANNKLPKPHHLHHIPHWIAYERRRLGGRVALLVMDGMSLAAWSVIGPAWRGRHPEWHFEQQLVLAQIPAITAVSRQALLSGERPTNFADTLTHNRQEEKQWGKFWLQENLGSQASALIRLRPEEGHLPAAVTSSRLQALALIYNGIDEMVHGETQGLRGLMASLHTWLEGEEEKWLVKVLAELMGQGYTVYLTSDHGHTEAWGMGRPSEGVTVETRSKRARIYRDYNAAAAVQRDYPQTLLWPSQRVLPEDTWVLLAGMENGRRLAFAQEGERVVTHGGITLDEMVVPVIRITT